MGSSTPPTGRHVVLLLHLPPSTHAGPRGGLAPLHYLPGWGYALVDDIRHVGPNALSTKAIPYPDHDHDHAHDQGHPRSSDHEHSRACSTFCDQIWLHGNRAKPVA